MGRIAANRRRWIPGYLSYATTRSALNIRHLTEYSHLCFVFTESRARVRLAPQGLRNIGTTADQLPVSALTELVLHNPTPFGRCGANITSAAPFG
jgi:hypothetical protein